MQIHMRLYLTYERKTEGFDGYILVAIQQAHISNIQVHTAIQSTS